MEEIIITKDYAVRGSVKGQDENTIVGVGSVMGNVDSYGDVIMPGAFDDVIKDFLVEGFVPVGHAWYGLPVAMPMKAYVEKGVELVVEAEFHSTQDAQDAKTVCKERIAKGKSVGLSIGFCCNSAGIAFFESGEAFLEFLEQGKWDLSLFDVKAIKKLGWMRAIIKIARLFEVSIVTVPANRKATATALKSVFSTAGDPGSHEGLSFELHSGTVLGAVRELINRAADIKSQRDAKGSSISASRLADLRQLHGLLGELLSAPPPVSSDLESKRLELLREAAEIEASMVPGLGE
jgi:phage head maturation protease